MAGDRRRRPGASPASRSSRCERLMALLGDPQHAMPVDPRHGHQRQGHRVADDQPSCWWRAACRSGRTPARTSNGSTSASARNGEPIPDEELAEVLEAVLDLGDLAERAPSWFELVTAAAFRWFAEAPVDVVVVEVGSAGSLRRHQRRRRRRSRSSPTSAPTTPTGAGLGARGRVGEGRDHRSRSARSWSGRCRRRCER